LPPVPRAVPIALALAATLFAPSRAAAHTPGLSRADLRVGPQRVAVDLVFARPEIAGLVPGADADRSGQLDEIELLSLEKQLSASVLDGLAIAADDVACAGAIDRIAFVEEDGLAIAASYTCPASPAALTVRIPLLARLAPGHRVVGRLVFADMSSETGPPALDFVAHRRRSALTLRRPTAPAPAPPAVAPAPAPADADARRAWPAAGVVATLLLAWGFLRRRRRA
jgi:hypothetical protein